MDEGGLNKRKDDFERQFEHVSLLTIPGKSGEPESVTTVKVTEIVPPNSKTERPLVFSQAFEHPLKVYEFMLHRLYDDGRITLTFDHPRAGGELPDLSPDERETVKQFENTPEEIRAAKLLLAVLESKNAVQADVMTHSRGIGYTAIAALIDYVRAQKEGRQNRIRNIVSYGPVGLIGDDSFGPLVGRVLAENFARPDWGTKHETLEEVARHVADDREKQGIPSPYEKVLEELKTKKAAAEARGIIEYGPPDEVGKTVAKEAATRMGVEGAKHILGTQDAGAEGGGTLNKVRRAAQGVARTLREGRGLANFHLDEVLPKLREMGIGVAVVRGSEDRVFPAERILNYTKKLRGFGVLDVQLTGVHDTITQDPRAAYILENLFGELEKQREATADTSA